MRIMFYSRDTRSISSAAVPGAIAVPGSVYQEFMDDQRSGAPLELDVDGVTPLAFSRLLTLSGLQSAVAAEVKEERALILNALTSIGYDALAALVLAAPGDPKIATYQAVQVAVAQAKAFLMGILKDPDVLAVLPGTDPGQGAQALKDLIYGKYKAYAATAPSIIKQAFAEVA